jgi:hypothetical protein
MSINIEDERRLNKIENIYTQTHENLIKLLKNKVKLEASRGNPERYRGYRKAVLLWMGTLNTTNNTTGKRKRERDRDRYKIEFNFTKGDQKKNRIVYLTDQVDIPIDILRAAFLSGEHNRLVYTDNDETVKDSNRLSDMLKLD